MAAYPPQKYHYQEKALGFSEHCTGQEVAVWFSYWNCGEPQGPRMILEVLSLPEKEKETTSQGIVQSLFQQMGTWLEKVLGSLFWR